MSCRTDEEDSMKRLGIALAIGIGTLAPLNAQENYEFSPKRRVYFDGALLLGASTGSLASDIPNNVAWGFRLGMQVPASPRFSVRLSLESLFFRVHNHDYLQGSNWMNEQASFDSMRAGADLIYEPRGARAGGPYFLIGTGSQHCSLNTTLSQYQTSSWPYGMGEVGDDTRAERTSAYFTVGAGWRWRKTYTELRVFNVNYDASAGQAPGVLPPTFRSSPVVEIALGCRL
jgi:hypothetical protein